MIGFARARTSPFAQCNTLELLGNIPGIYVVCHRERFGAVPFGFVRSSPLAPAQKEGRYKGYRKGKITASSGINCLGGRRVKKSD